MPQVRRQCWEPQGRRPARGEFWEQGHAHCPGPAPSPGQPSPASAGSVLHALSFSPSVGTRLPALPRKSCASGPAFGKDMSTCLFRVRAGPGAEGNPRPVHRERGGRRPPPLQGHRECALLNQDTRVRIGLESAIQGQGPRVGNIQPPQSTRSWAVCLRLKGQGFLRAGEHMDPRGKYPPPLCSHDALSCPGSICLRLLD